MTNTIPEPLKTQALAAVRATDQAANNRRACAVKRLRDATRSEYGPLPLPLRELIAAVDWALAQPADDPAARATGVEDRAVQALIAAYWLGEWERPVDGHDLAAAVATVLRVVRDDLDRAHRLGDVVDVPDAVEWLSARVEELTGRPTVTGDTSQPGMVGIPVEKIKED